VTDDDVIAEAYGDGFTLEERVASHTGSWAWGWIRGDDDRWPCFLERRQAIDYMADRSAASKCSREG
jgi:hypothetical protein